MYCELAKASRTHIPLQNLPTSEDECMVPDTRILQYYLEYRNRPKDKHRCSWVSILITKTNPKMYVDWRRYKYRSTYGQVYQIRIHNPTRSNIVEPCGTPRSTNTQDVDKEIQISIFVRIVKSELIVLKDVGQTSNRSSHSKRRKLGLSTCKDKMAPYCILRTSETIFDTSMLQ